MLRIVELGATWFRSALYAPYGTKKSSWYSAPSSSPPYLLQALFPPKHASQLTRQHVDCIASWFVIFAVVFYTAWLMLTLYLRRKRAALPRSEFGLIISCLPSLLHGTLCLVVTSRIVSTTVGWRLDKLLPLLTRKNTIDEAFIFCVSTAYFLADSLLFCVLYEFDLLFFGHHLICAFYMLTCLMLGKGALACVVVMLLGELTCPFQNLYLPALHLRGISTFWNDVYVNILPFYTYFYLAVRSFAAPCILLVTHARIAMASDLPLYLRCIWSLSILIGTLGSQGWSKRLRNELKLLRVGGGKGNGEAKKEL